MSKELVISAASHERRVAILEEGQLVEIYIEREKEFALVGSIYKGRVTRVLPGMQSAFVDIGLDGDAFLYVSDVFENLEEYEADHVDTPGPAATPHISVPAQIENAAAAAEGAEPTQAEGSQDPEPQPEAERPSETQAEASIQGDAQLQDSAGNREPQPRQNFQPRQEGDRNRGGGFRGGRGRWGQGGRGRGGRGPDRGRNLPPSKYASPQGHDQRGYDSRGPEQRRPDPPRYSPPAESGEEPIVLPGESLAKYRGRTPATMLPPDEPTAQLNEPRPETIEAVAPVSEPSAGPQHSVRGLPSWVLADGTTAAAAETETPAEERHTQPEPGTESASAAPVEELHAPREAPREEANL